MAAEAAAELTALSGHVTFDEAAHVQCHLDMGSRSASGHSISSQLSGSGAAGSEAGEDSHAGGEERPPVRPIDAKSSALKALAGISAVVSKSRKVDAEALQQIKSQRAKTKAKGIALQSQRSGTPPPAEAPSPFAAAAGLSFGRAASLDPGAGLPGGGAALALGHATSLPTHAGGRGGGGARGAYAPASPPQAPAGAPAGSFDDLVAKLALGELLALKEAVEKQLTKQALSLAGLRSASLGAPAPPPPLPPAPADIVSARYAAVLLSAQQSSAAQAQAQAQLATAQQAAAAQLSQQQAAAQAAAIQQALAAAAAAAGVSLPPAGGRGGAPPQTVSPDAAALMGLAGAAAAAPPPAGLSAFGVGGTLSMPTQGLPPDAEMASPFAAVAYGGGLPPESFSPPLHHVLPLGSAASARVASLGLAVSLAGPGSSVGGGADGSRASSPRTTSTEAHLIGDALRWLLDPTDSGAATRPSRQASLSWTERSSPAPVLAPAPAPVAGAPGAAPGLATANSRSLPLPPDAQYHDRSASLNGYLAGNLGELQQQQVAAAAATVLPSMFGAMCLQPPRADSGQLFGAPAPAPLPGMACQLSLRSQQVARHLATISEPLWQ
eukprot:scaffold14.g1161.t1